jgi:hypothetical protein
MSYCLTRTFSNRNFCYPGIIVVLILFQSAHLAMIDSILKAYTSHVVSIEKVVQAVR